MKLRLTEESCAQLYPTQAKGKKSARRTEVPLLGRVVQAGEMVELADEATAASLVLSGLMEPADAETGTRVAAKLEADRKPHMVAIEKIQEAAKKDAAQKDSDRALTEKGDPVLTDQEERDVANHLGYCASIDAALSKLKPAKGGKKED
jgi:hypothetical protein